MIEPCLPLRTVRMCSVGSEARTTGSPANGGNTRARPCPVFWWHAAQLTEKRAAPRADSAGVRTADGTVEAGAALPDGAGTAARAGTAAAAAASAGLGEPPNVP